MVMAPPNIVKISGKMLICSLTLVLFILATPFRTTHAEVHTFDEKCEEQKNVTTTSASGTSTLDIIKDSCDADQFLKCQNMRCICQDPSNQIFQPKEYVQPVGGIRAKRSPKKSGGGSRKGMSAGKAAAVGVGAGVVAGVGAYQVNKAIDHATYHPSSSSRGQSTSSSSNKGKKTITIKRCYTRIGGNCAINPDHTRYVVQNTTVNGKSTTFTNNIQVNYRKEISDCVQNAECKPKRNPGEDGNIGECVCRTGYYRDEKLDICIKEKRSSGAAGGIGSTKTGIFILVLSSFIFV